MLIYYTVRQLHDRTNIKESQIRLLAQLGVIPTVSEQRPYAFEYYAVEQWIDNGGLEKFITEYDHRLYILE